MLVPSALGRKQEITCEGSTLNIRCDRDEIIDIVRANYGRLSETICNEGGRKPIRDTNCKAGNSLKVVETKCANEQRCTVEAENRVFGRDPCLNTYKYLEVEYRCIPKRREPPSK